MARIHPTPRSVPLAGVRGSSLHWVVLDAEAGDRVPRRAAPRGLPAARCSVAHSSTWRRHALAVGLGEGAVEIAGQQLLGELAWAVVAHGASPAAAPLSSGPSAAASCLRARCRRDITVPCGTPSTSAISA